MASRLNPYVNFRSSAREAMEFYRSVFGGELTLSTFAQGGMPHEPAEADLIMHSQLETPKGFTLMASDTPSTMPYTPGTNYALSISGDDDVELRGYWDKLAAGGTVAMPLMKAPWGDIFGIGRRQVRDELDGQHHRPPHVGAFRQPRPPRPPCRGGRRVTVMEPTPGCFPGLKRCAPPDCLGTAHDRPPQDPRPTDAPTQRIRLLHGALPKARTAARC